MITFHDRVQFFIKIIKEIVSGKKSVTPVKNAEYPVLDMEPKNESDIPSYDPDMFVSKKDYIKYVSRLSGITNYRKLHELIKDKADISLSHIRKTLKSMQ